MCLYEQVLPQINFIQPAWFYAEAVLWNNIWYINNQGEVDVIRTAVTKTSNNMHILLLHKLIFYDFSNSLIELITSYLNRRHLFINYNSLNSNRYVATSGASQGYDLGRLLLEIFVNDLPERVTETTYYCIIIYT